MQISTNGNKIFKFQVSLTKFPNWTGQDNIWRYRNKEIHYPTNSKLKQKNLNSMQIMIKDLLRGLYKYIS